MKYLLFLFIALAWACASDQSDANTNGSSLPDENGSGELRNDQARVVYMPTPMQVPALLKNTDAVYDPTPLLPIVTGSNSYYKSGILFGIYMLDMAYAGSFSHQQASLNYFKACKRIGDDLGLGVKITENHLRRYEENITRPDSLGKIILQMYDLGHKVLIDQEKEGLGYLMVMGCYMEGLNLVLSQARQHDLILFVHLLRQQKDYANNLHSLLDQYEIPLEITAEYEAFVRTTELLNSTEIPSVYELKTGTKTIAGMRQENLNELTKAVADFRTAIQI